MKRQVPKGWIRTSCIGLIAILVSMSGGQAAVAKKDPKPCSTKSKRPCNPRAGSWSGVAVQQTPAGPESSPLTFTVERKGRKNRGTRFTSIQFGPRWWIGDISYVYVSGGRIAPSNTCPTCPPFVAQPGAFEGSLDKVSGQFLLGSTVIHGSGEREQFFFEGDFLNKRTAKGTIDGERTSSGGASFNLRTVTWTASPAS